MVLYFFTVIYDAGMMTEIDFLYTKEEALTLVRELIFELKREFPISKVVLFGSYARGEQEQFSDIDLLILLDCEVEDEVSKEIVHRICEYEIDNDVAIDALIFAVDEWDESPLTYEPIHDDVDEEGVEVG